MRAREDHGYTLIEVLVAASLGLVLLVAALALMVQGLHAQSHTMNRVSTTQTLETALAAMTNELRPAASVAYVSGRANLGITLTPASTVTPPGGPTAGSPVTYDCYTTSATCSRTIGNPPNNIKGALATGITNTDVFTLMCRTASGALQAVANGGSTAGCANAGALDYVAIKLVASVSCAGQGVSSASCTNGTVEVDGGTALRSQS